MSRKFSISILAVFIVCVFFNRAAMGDSKKAKPLRDGFVLSGVDGKLAYSDSNDKWFFEFDSEVIDDRGVIEAGQGVELLASSGFEKMTANQQKHPKGGYRLWGRITRYKGKNFIFAFYFLPVSEIESVESTDSNTTKAKPAVNSPLTMCCDSILYVSVWPNFNLRKPKPEF